MEAVVGDVADVIVCQVESLQRLKTNEHVVCHRRQLVMTQVTTIKIRSAIFIVHSIA